MKELNLNQCDKACHGCIKNYIKKHRIKKGDQFSVVCKGIPTEYLPKSIAASLDMDHQMAVAMYDPVTWAKLMVDWHCLDEDGAVWKKKTEDGTMGELPPYDEEVFNKYGSIFHRPYQAILLRCTSRRKAFRLGRQCIEKDEYVYTPSGPIKAGEVKDGTVLLGGYAHNVHSFRDELLEIKFYNGTSIKINGEHPFFVDGIGWVKAEDLNTDHWIQFENSQDLADLDKCKNIITVALDEYVSVNAKNHIVFSIGNSHRRAVEFQFVLWKLGISSTIKKEWMNKSTDWFYRVLVTRYEEKQKLLAFLNPDKYPEKFSVFCSTLDKKRKTPGLTPIENGYKVKIKSIKPIGKGTVVGWETIGNHEIASYCGMRTHNSGKTEALCISILYNIFTKENFRVVVIAPFQSQIDLIFKRLGELIGNNTNMLNSIKRNVKAPNYTIELHNGAQVTGFTAGTRSGQDAGAARGQHAQMLVFDEADYLSSGDIDAALAIITNFKDATVWMSSTPTGRREKFFETCNSKLFKEFHYPSYVNPNWTEETDALYREQLTEDGYKHEVCFLADTLVKTRDGIKKIIDIKTNDQVIGPDRQLFNVLRGARCTGQKSVVNVKTSAGRFACTPDHSFPDRSFAKTDLSELNQLPVLFPDHYSHSEPKEVMARLVGYNLGDRSSCSARYQSSFYSNMRDDIEHIVADLRYLFPKYRGDVVFDVVKGGECKLVKVDGNRFTANTGKSITEILLKHGVIRGKKTYQEFDVPLFVREGSSKIRASFLGALFGAEGSTPRPSKGYTPSTITLSINKQPGVDGHKFFQQLVDLLDSLHIKSTYTVAVNDAGYQTYHLYIGTEMGNMIRFLYRVGYKYSIEKERLAFCWLHYLLQYKYTLSIKRKIFHQARILRYRGDSYKEIMQATGLSWSQVDKAVNCQRKPTRLYRDFPTFSSWITDRLSDDYLFIDILERKNIGIAPVYNITVDSFDHSYLLKNGIRTFNCAEFGEQEEGIYQAKYVEAAQTSFEYGDYHYNPKWTYMIGVDWNDYKIGTTIAVVGYNPLDKYFYLVDKAIVTRAERTQLAACQKITELNRMWSPSGIYVDVGFGHTQIEVLHDYGNRMIGELGANHPDARLRNIVKGYNFGGNVEVRDLFTGQPVKKPAKPFLVENSVRRFESYVFKYPKSDKSYTAQLLGYIVDRVSVSGAPTYKAQNESAGDHFLDAVNLALVAFTFEKTKFGKPTYSTQIAFAGSFGGGGSTKAVDYQTMKQAASEHKPSNTRSDLLQDGIKNLLGSDIGELPAANTSVESSMRLWAWPGFGHDAPRPNPPSPNQKWRTLQKRTTRRKPPRRVKF